MSHAHHSRCSASKLEARSGQVLRHGVGQVDARACALLALWTAWGAACLAGCGNSRVALLNGLPAGQASDGCHTSMRMRSCLVLSAQPPARLRPSGGCHSARTRTTRGYCTPSCNSLGAPCGLRRGTQGGGRAV